MESQVTKGLVKTWHEFQVYGVRYRAVACVNTRLTDPCAQIPDMWDSYFTCLLQMRQSFASSVNGILGSQETFKHVA